MGYISVPNSFSTGGIVDSGKMNANWSAITSGISDGTKDLNIGSVHASGAVTAKQDLLVAGTMSVSGDYIGAIAHLETSKPTSNSVGFIIPVNWYFNYGYRPGSEQGWVMTRNGSILGHQLTYQCAAATSIQTSYCVAVNSSTLYMTLTITSPTVGMNVVSTYSARNTYSFVAGDRISALLSQASTGTMRGLWTSIIRLQFDS